MVTALLLIFDPDNTWAKIETTKRSVSRVFFMYLLPIMLLAAVAEGGLLLKLGVQAGHFSDRLKPVSQDLVVRYEIAQFVLGLAVCFLGAWLFQKFGAGFHRAHLYSDCFATLGYSLGPHFLLRILNGWPALNTWIAWAIGALLALSILYRGIPRLMKPDPSNALGLYLMCSLLILVLTGLSHFVATLILEEKILQAGVGMGGL
jgi:hypothetical protein